MILDIYIYFQFALVQNWYNTKHDESDKKAWRNNFADEDQYIADYLTLYQGVVGKVVMEESGDYIPWIKSSPSNGGFCDDFKKT